MFGVDFAQLGHDVGAYALSVAFGIVLGRISLRWWPGRTVEVVELPVVEAKTEKQ